jgi:hypothetical protein
MRRFRTPVFGGLALVSAMALVVGSARPAGASQTARLERNGSINNFPSPSPVIKRFDNPFINYVGKLYCFVHHVKYGDSDIWANGDVNEGPFIEDGLLVTYRYLGWIWQGHIIDDQVPLPRCAQVGASVVGGATLHSTPDLVYAASLIGGSVTLSCYAHHAVYRNSDVWVRATAGAHNGWIWKYHIAGADQIRLPECPYLPG